MHILTYNIVNVTFQVCVGDSLLFAHRSLSEYTIVETLAYAPHKVTLTHMSKDNHFLGRIHSYVTSPFHLMRYAFAHENAKQLKKSNRHFYLVFYEET